MNQQSIKKVYRESQLGSEILIQKDVINIGNSISIENHEKPHLKEFKQNRYNEKHEYKSSHNLENFFGYLIKFIGFLTVAVIFWSFLRFWNGSDQIQIELFPVTLFCLSIFFITMIIAVFSLFNKKKLKLRYADDKIHISSFPNFSQKIPADLVHACYIDISNGRHYQNRVEIDELALGWKTKVKLENGLLVELKNGKNFTISSSAHPVVNRQI